MRTYFILLLLLLATSSIQGQLLPDSILKSYRAAPTQKSKSILLWKHIQTNIFWNKKSQR